LLDSSFCITIPLYVPFALFVSAFAFFHNSNVYTPPSRRAARYSSSCDVQLARLTTRQRIPPCSSRNSSVFYCRCLARYKRLPLRWWRTLWHREALPLIRRSIDLRYTCICGFLDRQTCYSAVILSQ
jgi:hypothetical protein